MRTLHVVQVAAVLTAVKLAFVNFIGVSRHEKKLSAITSCVTPPILLNRLAICDIANRGASNPILADIVVLRIDRHSPHNSDP